MEQKEKLKHMTPKSCNDEKESTS